MGSAPTSKEIYFSGNFSNCEEKNKEGRIIRTFQGNILENRQLYKKHKNFSAFLVKGAIGMEIIDKFTGVSTIINLLECLCIYERWKSNSQKR